MFSLKKIIWSSIIIGLIGSGLHFIYEALGQWPLIGLIGAIDESVWEHTKLAFVPMTVFWLYLAFKDKENRYSLLSGGIVAVLTAIFLIISLFYTYTQAFGTESLVIDIVIFFIAVFAGQFIGAHVAQHSNNKTLGTIALILFIVLIILYIVFTYAKPDIPLFLPPEHM